MRKVGQRQLSFVFADRSKEGREELPSENEGMAYLRLIAKARKSDSPIAREVDESRLLEEVASSPNLAIALLHVRRQKGAGGVDGRSVEEVVASVKRLLPRLRHELLSGKYRPGDIRRVWISKPGGGRRGLGIPNVVDRWVQQAVLQVLGPIFEPSFHESSHGFRPGRGVRTAIEEAKEHIADGKRQVVNLDISKFFDRVSHQRLLGRMARKVKDSRILKLVHRMLKAKVVMPDGTRVATKEGTPQGGPLSPILSNIVLDELDWELERRGLSFVRYADDANIFVRSRRAGRRVMDSVTRFLERRLRLKVNEEKSHVAISGRVHFLGFSLKRARDGRVEVYLSDRSRERLKDRIKEFTPRCWGQSLDVCFERVNRYLRGWSAYFRLCTEKGARYFRRMDAHIRRRIRATIIHQKKRNRFLFRHLLALGVGRNAAAATAFQRRGIWHRSHSPGIEQAYGNVWFRERLVSLWLEWRRLNPPALVSGQLLLFDSESPT